MSKFAKILKPLYNQNNDRRSFLSFLINLPVFMHNSHNFLSAEENKPLKGRKSGRIKIFKIGVFLFVFIFLLLTFLPVSKKGSDSWLNKIPLISQLRYLVESADKDVKGEERDQINILLLGMGGKNHDGGYLTDTIILASLKPSEKKVALVSIPRDLAVPLENLGWRKINNVNAYAERDKPGSGGLAASQALSDILDIPIDYYVRVDFAGFVQIIDSLGGVEIEVENTLDDYSYPITGQEEAEPYEARFEHLRIEKGQQKMDGSLALKYARSRHAAGVEGSDFARARRQQKIIQAVKDKLLRTGNLFNPGLISELLDNLDKNLSTNLKIWEVLKLWQMFKDVKSEDIINRVLDNGANGLLVDSISAEGAYILTPTSGDFSEIQYLIKNIFTDAPLEQKSKVKNEKTKIEVYNGTWINGLANKIALDLEKYSFDVIDIGNCSRQDFQSSVIYDLTFGEKMESLAVLKEKIGANVSLSLPQWLLDDLAKKVEEEKNPSQPDFILILGQDADLTSSGRENKE